MSDIKPTFIGKKDPLHYLEFSQGIVTGIIKGGVDSSLEFVPSLFSSIWGLGKGLWSLVTKPIVVSKEFIEACATCLDFLKDKSVKEISSSLAAEIQECLEKWEKLKDDERGYFIGYLVGRYGVDVFAWSGSVKAMKAYQELKKANTILTLDYAASSSKAQKEIEIASKEYFEWREEYKKKCKLHLGQQEKHIPGTNNFIPGRGELLVSPEKIEKLAKSKLGTGVPSRASFGEASYRETVDFGEIIGIHVVQDTVERIPTSIGDIHYKDNGLFHVIPVEPNKLKRLENRKKR